MRFVHLADVHLGASFPGRTRAVRDRLRAACREAFARAVDLAIRADAHAFLIAGDLLDADRLPFRTERFLVEQTERLLAHGVTPVYATGNHDPGGLEAGRRAVPWPAGVRVADSDTPQRFRIVDRDGTPVGSVTAVGHTGPRESRDLSRLLPPPDRGDLPQVALLHTQVHASIGSEAHHAYAPSELSRLVRAGFDYWALGHVHIPQRLADDPPVVYAGTPQGRTHADQGARGAWLVDLSDRHHPALSFRELAPVRWITLRVAGLEGAHTLDDLERRIQEEWGRRTEEEATPAGTEWMVRVILSGPAVLWRELRREENLETLRDELTGILGALDVTVVAGAVHPPVPLEEYRAREDVLGEALRLLERVRRGGEGVADLVGADLADAPSAAGDGFERYVRRILDGADATLIARFLPGGEG